MRSLPIITGFLTVLLIGGVGYVVWQEGSMLWGGVALAFAGLRAVLLARQLWFRLRPLPDDDDNAGA